MDSLESAAIRVRRSPLLRRSKYMLQVIRPLYQGMLRRFKSAGLERTINGTDSILIDPELYTLGEVYEPEVWQIFFAELRPGDVVADVGAAYGLYTIAAAKHIGARGRVYAFEPDPQTVKWLASHVKLNGVDGTVAIFPCVVGNSAGQVAYATGHGLESHVLTGLSAGNAVVPATTLDLTFATESINILKIDVEGFEQRVLQGAAKLLSDPIRAPRTIFMEVHPFAWEQYQASGATVLKLLHDFNYEVFDVDGAALDNISEYGEIVARRITRPTAPA